MSGTGDCVYRADAIEALYKDAEAHPEHTFWTTQHEALLNIPAADVRPVVRGRWETVMLDHERMGCRPTAHYCSECHQITWFRTFFCPNCGADMREE